MKGTEPGKCCSAAHCMLAVPVIGMGHSHAFSQIHPRFCKPLQGKLCKPATAVSLAVALLLTGVMYKLFLSTGKMMPAGVVALLSAGMSIFYVWNLLAVKPPAGHHAS